MGGQAGVYLTLLEDFQVALPYIRDQLRALKAFKISN